MHFKFARAERLEFQRLTERRFACHERPCVHGFGNDIYERDSDDGHYGLGRQYEREPGNRGS